MRSQSGTAGHFSVEIEPSNGPVWRIKFSRKEEGGIQIKEWQLSDEKSKYHGRFTPQMSSDEIRRLIPKEAVDTLPDILKNALYEIDTDRCFFEVSISRDEPISERSFRLPIFSFSHLVTQLVRGVIHLPGLRGNPERTYPVSAIGHTFDGTFETYTASVIAFWENHHSTTKIASLRDALEHLGLTWKVEAKPLEIGRAHV